MIILILAIFILAIAGFIIYCWKSGKCLQALFNPSSPPSAAGPVSPVNPINPPVPPVNPINPPVPPINPPAPPSPCNLCGAACVSQTCSQGCPAYGNGQGCLKDAIADHLRVGAPYLTAEDSFCKGSFNVSGMRTSAPYQERNFAPTAQSPWQQESRMGAVPPSGSDDKDNSPNAVDKVFQSCQTCKADPSAPLGLSCTACSPCMISDLGDIMKSSPFES